MDYAFNRRAGFDYETLEKITAGLALRGWEVKAIKSGRANLNGVYAIVRGNEIYLINLAMTPEQPNNLPVDYEADRTIKLLLTRKEIASLTGKIKEKGLGLVPLRLFGQKNKIKAEIVIGKSKKKADKRETIKKRDIKREIERGIKR
ncbi:MAG: SsrA-binding protein SmpB [bacterium]|nr:SsrA-binding protein SmpB [bacterium]